MLAAGRTGRCQGCPARLYIMSRMTPVPPAPADSRQYSALDRLLGQFDQALRTVATRTRADRPSPAATAANAELTSEERSRAAGLMRVNHAGEVAAQALYYGQALTAASPATRAALLKAAQEEGDHLAWCAQRLEELGSHTSYINPVWYVGSFTIGAVAGLAGDRSSLGFVAETERQVEEHLSSHLNRLPEPDSRSRAIVSQMQLDEREHGRYAVANGGVPLPEVIRRLMRVTARIMTSTSYWV